jgi:hypothetical protein
VTAGRGAQAHDHGAEHRAHEHRQREQRRVVDVAALQHLQRGEGGEVDADGQQPQRGEAADRRLEVRIAQLQPGGDDVGSADAMATGLHRLPERKATPCSSTSTSATKQRAP